MCGRGAAPPERGCRAGRSYRCRVLLPVSPALGVVLAVLLVFAAAVAARAGLGRSREILAAGVRAAVQLAAVSLLIGWVALLGGASPVEAGAVQLFVLVALMAVQVVAVATVLELVARGRLHRE
ncbi:hypothetical protein SMICM304S_04667 [Streptomyces microflavus]